MTVDDVDREVDRLRTESAALEIAHARLSATPHTAGELEAHFTRLRAHVARLRACIEQMRQRSKPKAES